MKISIKNIVEYFILLKNNIFKKATKSQNINILILISRLNNGGAERVATNLANNFKERYNNVIVVTYNNKTEKDYQFTAERIVIENKKISRVNELKRIKKKYNITHCISFCTTANYLNVASNNGEKKIISIRNYLSLNKKENGIKKLEAIIASKFADKIVTVSQTIEVEQVEKYKANKEKLITINNFYEENIITSKREEGILEQTEEEFFKKHDVIINIGRLSYQKGQWYLIRVFKEIVKEFPNTRLVILGEGEYKERLQQLIDDLKMNKYIKLYGFKTNPYIYLSKSKIFVLESLYEGMSNVLLEAMCCGLPIIATDCLAGNREIIAPNTDIMKHTEKIELAQYGIIVPVGDGKIYEQEGLTKEEKELKKAIIKLLTNKDLKEKYIKESKSRIKDFDKNKIIQKWYEVIESDYKSD